nr:MAG TPA: hypothetical protein [Caudoviricetes sp.]
MYRASPIISNRNRPYHHFNLVQGASTDSISAYSTRFVWFSHLILLYHK